MNPPLSASCDARRLQLSLDDALSETEEESLVAHLTQCSSCREALEQLAAERIDWQRVGQVLRDESAGGSVIGRAVSSSGPDETLGYRASSGDYAASPLDFAVDFLNAPSSPEAIGRLGDIDILKVIGYGGMGIVLKGFQPALNRFVAVKVLAPHLATSGAARQRFAREARAAAAVVHPHVMPIFTVDASGRLPYLVMPLVDGESLQERIDRQGAMDPVDVLRIGMQVARGLAAAHAQGLVHRDVKPANILLERGVDRVVLTDFGLARAADDASLTRSGLIAGTPQYMSPEQARGDSIDARSDLFSLGSVLYTMCTGRPPFRADTSYGILRRIIDTDPRPIHDCQPSVPPWLVNLINRLLAKGVDARYGSAVTVAEIMEQCLAHLQQPAVAPIPAELSRAPGRRLRRVTALVAAAVLTVGLGGFAAWTTWTRAGDENTTPQTVLEADDARADDARADDALAKIGRAASVHELAVEDQSNDAERPGGVGERKFRLSAVESAAIDRELEQLKWRIEELQRLVEEPW
jgi:serine/threonine-protein kinase